MECDFYSRLGVSRFASQDEIKRAFHSRILLVHPDRNPDTVAADRARELIEAYKALADPSSRHTYDLATCRPAAAAPACRIGESAARFWAARAVVAVVFLALSIGLVFGVADALASRGPVFRPCLGAIDVTSIDPPPAAVVAGPDVFNVKEWYAAEEYNMSMANGSATSNLIRAYTAAAKRAFQAGRSDTGRFYSRCVREIQDMGPRVEL